MFHEKESGTKFANLSLLLCIHFSYVQEVLEDELTTLL